MKIKFGWILALAIGFATSPALAFDDDEGGYGTSCTAPYGTWYNGYLFSADGSATNGTVTIREARGSKRGASLVSVYVSPAAGNGVVDKYVSELVGIPTAAYAVTEDGKRKLSFIINWDYVKGILPDGQTFVASRNGRDDIVNAHFPVLELLKGYWTFSMKASFATTNEVASADDEQSIACALQIKDKGRYSLTTMMPNGWKFISSGKMVATENGYSLSVSKSRKYQKGTESFGFSVTFLSDSEGLIVAPQDWCCVGGTNPFEAQVALDRAGKPLLTKAMFKTVGLVLENPDLDVRSRSINAKTGIVSGKARWPYTAVSSRGKVTTRYKNATIWGVDVGGVCAGSAWVKNYGTTDIAETDESQAE